MVDKKLMGLEHFVLWETVDYRVIPLPCFQRKVRRNPIIYSGLETKERYFVGKAFRSVPMFPHVRVHDECTQGVEVAFSMGVDPFDELGGYNAKKLVEVYVYVGEDPRDVER